MLPVVSHVQRYVLQESSACQRICAPQAGVPIHWSFWLVQCVTMAKAECQATCFGKPCCMGASAFVQVPVMVTGARREGLAAL